MKRIAVFLAFALILTVGVAAAEGVLELPDDTKVIEEEAFYNVDAETIILPLGVKAIGDRAFGGSSKLREVYVPESLMNREAAALEGSGNAKFVPLPQDWSAEYDYDIGDNTATVLKYKGTDTEVWIPALIEGKPVTVIGNSCFKSNTTLEEVIIPEGVTEIQFDAFDGCSALTAVTFPSTLSVIGSNAFRRCGSSYEGTFYYYLPDHLTAVAGIENGTNYAFSFSDAVMAVNPDTDTARLLSTSNVDGDGRGCFTYPGELDFRYKFYRSEANGPYDTLHLMAYKGSGTEVMIPDHGTASTRISVIHHGVFQGMETLTEVVIPEGVTEIQYDAFDGCYALTDVTFPSTLSVIGSNALRRCGSSYEGTFYYYLPDHLTAVAGIENGTNYAFSFSDAIMAVNPDTDTARLLSTSNVDGDGRGCFTYPDELDFRYKFYQSEAGGLYDTLHLMAYKGSGTEVVIPDHGTASTRISVIHHGVFQGMETLTKVVIPESVTEIQYDAFDGCYALTDVTFPSTLSVIGSNALRRCGSSYEGTFYYYLPDHLTAVAGIENGTNYSFAFSNAVMVVNPDTDTARLLSTSNVDGDGRGCFTYPDELDFRYKFYQSADNGPYNTLHLMAYKGSGTEVVIPDHGTASTRISIIHHSVFDDMTTLTKVVIPEGVTEIQYDAFDGCTTLTDVTFPSTLSIIGGNAFKRCAVDITGNVFYDLPDNITTIAGTAFDNCPVKLCCNKYISVDYSDETPTAQALGDRWWGWAEGPFRLTYYSVPFTVVTETETTTQYETRLMLGGYVAEPDPEPLSIEIPESVYAIGEDCFRGMVNLYQVVMPDYDWHTGDNVPRYVKRIEARAFMDCPILTDITFSPALSWIGENAFSGCGNSSGSPYTFEFHYPDDTRAGLEVDDTDPNHIVYSFPGCNANLLIHWVSTSQLLD